MSYAEEIIAQIEYTSKICRKIINEPFEEDLEEWFVKIDETNWRLINGIRNTPIDFSLILNTKSFKLTYRYLNETKNNDKFEIVKTKLFPKIVKLVEEYVKENPPPQ